MSSEYVKFKVTTIGKADMNMSTVPWTGSDQTLEYVKEAIESGKIVTIIPYTREEWSSLGNR